MYNRQEASCSGRYQLVWMTLFAPTHKAEGVKRNQRQRPQNEEHKAPFLWRQCFHAYFCLVSPPTFMCYSGDHCAMGFYSSLRMMASGTETDLNPGVCEGLCSWDELAQCQLSFLNLFTMDNWGWGPSIWPTDLMPTSGLSWPCSPLWALGFIWLQHSRYPIHRPGGAGERFIPLSSTPFLGILVHQ